MAPNFTFLGMDLYTICITVGLVLTLCFVDFVCDKKGFSVALQRGVLIAGVAAIFAGFIFATLFQSLYNYLETGEFRLQGMTFYGGFLGGVGFFLLLYFFVLGRFCKDSQEPKKRFSDLANAAAVAIPMAHGFGRLGCLFSGCCYGKITDAWYAVPMQIKGAWVKAVPIQLFEAVFLFVLAGVLACLLLKGRGTLPLLPTYTCAYGIWRFFIEYARADARGATVLSFLTPSQLTAVLLLVGGGIYYIVYYCKAQRKKR